MAEMKTLTLNNVTYDIADSNAIRFIEQALTDEQKAQARENIGVSDSAIPIPEIAQVGQTIKVSAVDENGKPIAWEAADFSVDKPDEYVVLFNKTLETNLANSDEWGGESHQYTSRHFWTTDVDGNDIDADGIYVIVHVPSQSEVTGGEIKVHVGQGKPTNWMSWGGGNQAQPYIGRASFIASNSERWAMWEFDLRNQTLKGSYVAGPARTGNFQGANQQYAISFSQAVMKNNWTSWSGVEIILISGSFPAGTQLFCYARKRNPDKIVYMPTMEVST